MFQVKMNEQITKENLEYVCTWLRVHQVCSPSNGPYSCNGNILFPEKETALFVSPHNMNIMLDTIVLFRWTKMVMIYMQMASSNHCIELRFVNK